MHEYLLDSVEVAKRLNVSRAHVYYLIARGDIPAIRVGAAIRVHPDALQEYMNKWKWKKLEPRPRRQKAKVNK